MSEPFWIVGSDHPVYLCVGPTLEQGQAWIAEANALYESIGSEERLTLERHNKDRGYWADCGTFYLIDHNFMFREVNLRADKKHPTAYGRFVLLGRRFSREEMNQGIIEMHDDDDDEKS